MASTLKEKHTMFTNALASLNELVDGTKTDKVTRDATIQRFEYTVEAFWKLLKLYLFEHEGVDVGTPKSVFRETGNAGLLSEPEIVLALTMIDDRNETVHLYNEPLAEEIHKTIPRYRDLMRDVSARLQMDA